ncbi:uncharacterized protein [Fopius arisanus]|uniref:Uncharacterized protein isoform X1 n=1 Tax=Fopius arisanus TaxID=64838 RepID=A0A9R1THM5_9HYME|nr:PREDICTED: uncharacterized protein LOC105270255 isoform X1 [Fopius arisanus]
MALSAFDQELLSLISEYDIIWREDASMDTGFWVDAAFQQVVLILSIDCSERFPNEYLFFAYVKQRWEELLTWRYNHYKMYVHTNDSRPSPSESNLWNAMAFLPAVQQ